MKLSHLNGLRALETTLRRGSFTAAADEMGVSVAAVGQQIRGLEDYLGVKLFDRRPSGAVATDDARRVAATLTVGFGHIEDALRRLAAVHDAARLRVATFKWFHEDWLTERMPAFHARHPAVSVDFLLGDRLADLVGGEADMAIRIVAEVGPEFATAHLFDGGFLPVCTPDFARAHGLGTDTGDLSGVPLLRFATTSGDPAIVHWDTLIARHGLLRAAGDAPERVGGTRAALAGHGLLLCGLMSSFADLRAGRLVAPLGPRLYTPYSIPYRLVWPAGRSLTPAMRGFRDWLLAECAAFLRAASEIVGIDLS